VVQRSPVAAVVVVPGKVAAAEMTPTPAGDPSARAGPLGRTSRHWRFLWSALVVGVAAAAAGAWISLRSADAAPAPTDDIVVQALRKGKPTVVEFGANVCATCRDMKPVLAQLARDYGHRIEVIDVDLIKRRAYIAGYRIQLMPTQVFFDARGREIGRHMGKIGPEEILDRLGVADAKAAK
jgi:thioredoxin 1